MATEQEIGMVMAKIAAAFPQFTMSAETVAVYAELLGDVRGELLYEATMSCICKCKYPPKIAEILEEAGEIADEQRLEFERNRPPVPRLYEPDKTDPLTEERRAQIRAVTDSLAEKWGQSWLNRKGDGDD